MDIDIKDIGGLPKEVKLTNDVHVWDDYRLNCKSASDQAGYLVYLMAIDHPKDGVDLFNVTYKGEHEFTLCMWCNEDDERRGLLLRQSIIELLPVLQRISNLQRNENQV